MEGDHCISINVKCFVSNRYINQCVRKKCRAPFKKMALRNFFFSFQTIVPLFEQENWTSISILSYS